jgi:AcrR family transcriptional regulator
MSPRKYDMTRRASAVAQTRERIVEATRELHGEQGIAATSWDDIAARAGVGVGTVYRHFPSLDELIPACGEISMRVIALPEPGDARSLFDGAGDRAERLVREVFAVYERGAPQLVDAAGIAADRRVVRALIDLGTWQALRDQGLTPAEAVEAVSRMLA